MQFEERHFDWSTGLMRVSGLTVWSFFWSFAYQSSRASDVVAEAGPRKEKPDDGDVEHTAEFKNILKEVEELGSFKASFSRGFVLRCLYLRLH
jgi:hypothetical protein